MLPVFVVGPVSICVNLFGDRIFVFMLCFTVSLRMFRFMSPTTTSFFALMSCITWFKSARKSACGVL